MRIMPTRKRRLNILLVILLLILIALYIEVYTYTSNAGKWKDQINFNEDEESDSEPLRVLLIADPQIQGEKNEHFLFGFFTRWDSDKYLSRNYNLAKRHVKPHVVIFLGDIFDEGSIATEPEYQRYYRRITNIFKIPRNQDVAPIKYIFLPGDNDIGGEGSEPLKETKIKWFNKTFGDFEKTTWFKRDGIDVQFLNINSFLFVDNKDYFKTYQAPLGSQPNVKILLSHESLLQSGKEGIETMLKNVKPQLIFSAHSHKSSHVILQENNELEIKDKFLLRDSKASKDNYNSSLTLDLNLVRDNNIIHQINVPTCSYRMGTTKIGIGTFLIYNNGTFKYTVLWLPKRLTQLFIYIRVCLVMIPLVLFGLLKSISTKTFRTVLV